MSDDKSNDADASASEDKPDPEVVRRKQAQGAAGDLARMGIDPRSLGLGESSPPPPVRRRTDSTQGGSVLPLRPEYSQPATPQPPARPQERPVAPHQASTTPPVAPRSPMPPPPPFGTPGAAPPGPPAPVGNVPSTEVVAPPTPVRETPLAVRRAARGAVTPDAAAAMQGERRLIDAVRTRQTNRRVVSLISGKGGVGCTTIAIALGTVFVAMRDDRSVLVDVQQGTPSLGELLRVAQPRSTASILQENEAVDPPMAASGLAVLDGGPWDQTLRRGEVAGVLERLGNEHVFNLLDVGNDAGEGGHTALARADQVVVVTSAGPFGVAALQTAFERVRQVNPAAVADAVTVVVCQTEAVLKEAKAGLRGQPRVVLMPPESWLASGRPFDPAQVSSATRAALLELAALIAARKSVHV